MLLLFAAALAASPAPNAVVRAQSRVSVRIISGARISPGGSADAPGQRRRQSRIRLDDGTYHTAQLIEFN